MFSISVICKARLDNLLLTFYTYSVEPDVLLLWAVGQECKRFVLFDLGTPDGRVNSLKPKAADVGGRSTNADCMNHSPCQCVTVDLFTLNLSTFLKTLQLVDQ